jgi:hypothetical protein
VLPVEHVQRPDDRRVIHRNGCRGTAKGTGPLNEEGDDAKERQVHVLEF